MPSSRIKLREPVPPQISAKIPNRLDDDLRKFAMDYVENCIFTSANVQNKNDLGMVFMVLLLGAFKGYSEEEINDIGLIFEYTDKAGPRCINGMPIFLSCQFLNQHDAKLFWQYVGLLQSQRKAFLDHKII